ncbi:MAG: SDR family NAD(P)-dependent oxidoreductase [Bacteroidia bacterium]|nr:SDR family NAD(P)-dependent oxidoreductase [Bacteroidia bacterium]
MKTVLITGATSGIGKATAEILADKEYRLIICGRRADRLQEIAKKLNRKTEVFTLCFDISRRQEVQNAFLSLPENYRDIDILINNAGNAHGLSTIQDGDLDDWESMIDINIKGLLYITKEILPGMIERNEGHIINLGSVAGKEVYPMGNVYCASKFAVDAINRALRIDLNEYNIRVGAVNPGLVETEFSLVRFKGDEDRAKTVYKGYKPLKPEDVAEIISFMIHMPAHVNIADLTVFPSAQAAPGILRKK